MFSAGRMQLFLALPTPSSSYATFLTGSSTKPHWLPKYAVFMAETSHPLLPLTWENLPSNITIMMTCLSSQVKQALSQEKLS